MSIETATIASKATIPSPATKTEQPKVLKPTALMGAEYAYATYAVTLPEGWTVEDALKPEFWVNVAHKFSKQPVTGEPDKTGAIIELRTVDHAFYARLYVRAVQERALIVTLLEAPIYFGPKEVLSFSFSIRWNVGKRGYDIIRKSDNQIVAGGEKIKTKDDAQAWIDETVKVH